MIWPEPAFYCDVRENLHAYLTGEGWRTLVVRDWVEDREVHRERLTEILKYLRLDVAGSKWAVAGALVPSDRGHLVTPTASLDGLSRVRYAAPRFSDGFTELHEVRTDEVAIVGYYIDGVRQPREFPDGSVMPFRQMHPEIVWGEAPEGGYQYRDINGKRYLNTCEAGGLIIGQRNGRTEGVDIATGREFLVSEEEWKDPRLAFFDGRWIACSWLENGRMEVVELPPFVEIAEPLPVMPSGGALNAFPRRIWLAAYKTFGVPGHGDVPPADIPGNAVFPEDGSVGRAAALGRPMIVSVQAPDRLANLNLTIAWYAHGTTLEALQALVEEAHTLPERPIIAYLDGRDWPAERPEWISDRVWPNIQCYRGLPPNVQEETLEEFESRVGALIERVSAYGRPIGLTIQCYDRNGATSEEHALSTLSAVERWVRDYEVVNILPFAFLRAGGMKDYAALRAWVSAAANAIPLRPSRYGMWAGADRLASWRNRLQQNVNLIEMSEAERLEEVLPALEAFFAAAPPPPPPDDAPIPFPAEVREILTRYSARHPVPQIEEGEEPEAHEARARAWTIHFAEQVMYERFSEGYGCKSSSEASPISKDSLAQQRASRLVSWDLLIGTGTGHPVIAPDPAFHDITGQQFRPVAPINHL